MSGNSGAEQLNNKVSVPVKETETDGEETPVETSNEIESTCKEDKPNYSEESIIEEVKEENSFTTNEQIAEDSTEIIEDTTEENVNNTEQLIDTVNDEEVVENSIENDDNKVLETEPLLDDSCELIEKETVQTDTEEIKGDIEENFIIEVDTTEVVDGFEEARSALKGIYKIALNETFKPSLNDATVDLLAYVGARAEAYGKSEEFKKAFGVDVSRFSERYRQNDYLPIAFKISVWADKNKGLDKTVEILNGILQSLFALNIGKNEVESVEIVKTSIGGVIKYLESAGINSGF